MRLPEETPRHRAGSWLPRFAAVVMGTVSAGLAAGMARAEAPDFGRDIRPILAENCFYCHGQDAAKRQADLRLDQRAAAIAARAIVPGETGASTLLERIHSTDAEVVMPPPASNRRLGPEQKALLERWIAAGAPYADHWAFVAPKRPPVPEPAAGPSGWPAGAIDRFVLAGLVGTGLAPSPEADRPTLIRRLHADLVGLPPTPEEVDAFVADPDPAAYDHLVDRLLASPHYGERMALPWLDAARYADSNGFQQDGDTWQWIWRDWVVRALNDDLPFDRFTIQQLAGDLLDNATTDEKIASAFNRNHLLNGEGGAIAEEQRFNTLFDRVDTTATTWLGLTMACAQCHDHKYDPLTQTDYYRLLDAFNRVPETGAPQYFSTRIRVAPPLVELPTAENTAAIADFEQRIAAADEAARPIIEAAFAGWRTGVLSGGAEGRGLPEPLVERLRKPDGERSAEEKQAVETDLRTHFDAKVRGGVVGSQPAVQTADGLRKELAAYRADRIPRVMVMSDERPRETRLLGRGDYLTPQGEPLGFAPPAFLPPLPADLPANRLGLARWLFTPEQPLTARVHVNRMWQHFFGTGLVKTAEDFGVQAEYPRHRDLLDWLAVEFRDGGWSQKRIHRLIVTSATYRQASRMTPAHLALDPENRLLARGSRFRMPAQILRDWALAAAGLLDRRIGGPPVYPYQPEGIWESLAITKERDFTYPTSQGADLHRRSLYTFWRRTVSPANMFDTANRQTCRVRASVTSTPLHALTTLNDPTWVEAARNLAARCLTAADSTEARLALALRLVVGRPATTPDIEALTRMHRRQREIYAADPAAAARLVAVGASPRDAAVDPVDQAALAAVCLAILNLDESLTRE
jgi:cytochrome c553